MRLALFVFAIFVVTFAATTKKEGKRQINEYLPNYGPTQVIEPRQLRPTLTTTTTKVSTVTYTLTCIKSTAACAPSSSTTTSTTPSTTTSTTPSTTASTTPSTTASTTPSTTASTTPSTTASTTPSTTASTTPSTTASSSTPSTTASSSTPSTTISPSSASPSRRRQIDNVDNLEIEDWAKEQLWIVPSNVQGVEATQTPVREGRAAYPQLLPMLPPFGYYYPQEIQPGFDNDPTLSLPFYGSYVQPAAVSQPRIFFGGFFNGLFPGFAVTKTETFISVTVAIATFTSSQTCSTPGSFLQCLA